MPSFLPISERPLLNPDSLCAPFLVEPAFYARPWGSQDLRPWYQNGHPEQRIGEVWLTDLECRVINGPMAGKTLGEVIDAQPAEWLGAAPELLLIKVIFAQEKLSVQVHPDDALARKYGAPRGKTECWYALEAQPGAEVALGFKPGATLETLRAQIATNTLEESLQAVPVRKGEMLLVEAGMVHAIWPGSVMLEVQQYCDLTYRLYDYGRPRELHVEKALEATRIDAPALRTEPRQLPDRSLLVETPYFRVERVDVPGSLSSLELANGEPTRMQYLFAAAGRARIAGPGFDAFELPKASLAVIPAAAAEFTVENLGDLELIRVV